MSIFDEGQPIENVDIHLARFGKVIENYQECKLVDRKDSIRLPGYVNVKKDGFVVPQPGFVTVMNHLYGEDNWIPVSGIKYLPGLNNRAWVYETLDYANGEIGDIYEDPRDSVIGDEVSDEDYKTLVDKIVSADKDAEIAIYANNEDKITFFGVFKLDSIESILQHRLILRFKSYTEASLRHQT